MITLTRVLTVVFPPVPRGLRSRIQTPVVGAWGSASASGDTPASADSTPAGAGQTPEGEGVAPPSRIRGVEPPQRRPSPSGPPAVERHQSTPLHPSVRYRFEDRALAILLDQWGAPS